MAEQRTRNPRGQGERLRLELIEAASRLLESQPGEEFLSLRAVAREAGVAAPSVYRHFADRGELMLAVQQRRFGEFAVALAEAEGGAGRADPAGRLRARCRAYCAYARAHPGAYRVMFGAVPTTPPPDGAELIGAGLVHDLAARIAACSAVPERSARERGLLLWCGLHGLATLPETKPAVDWPEVNGLVDALIDTVCGP